MFKKTERNFDNIQFEELRKKIDKEFNDLHDELSECYYDKKPFREYGILDKETFDKLHGLVFMKRDVKFHKENLKQPPKDRIPEKEYNNDVNIDGKTVKRIDTMIEKIKKLKDDNIEL